MGRDIFEADADNQPRGLQGAGSMEPQFRSMASIKSHFEQRADLDVFWAADVDFTKGRVGMRTTAQDQIRKTSRPRGLSGATVNELSGKQPPDDSGHSWLLTARTHTPWDFESIYGTLQAGLKVAPGGTSTLNSTCAFDDKRLSDLSMLEGTVYPGGHAGLDADESTVGEPDTAEATHTNPRTDARPSQHNNSLNFNPLFGEEAESGQCTDNATAAETDDPRSPTEDDVVAPCPLHIITQQLSSPPSPEAVVEASQQLTAHIVDNPAEEWEAPVAKTIINRLLPHITAASSSKAHADPENNCAAAQTAITALCAIASHGLPSTSEELAKQGAVSAAISAAQAALLPDPLTASVEALNMATAITRGALLPIIRNLPAAIVLARTRDAAAQPPLLAFATLGGTALDCCSSSSNVDKTAAVSLLLAVLQCVHAALSHGSLELLKACCQAGLFQLAIDTYAVSHSPSVQAVHAWELRKALAVLAEVSSIFTSAEDLSTDMMMTQDVKQHRGQVTLSSDAVRDAITASAAGSAAALLNLLVEDVKLRDRPHLASLAVRALHTLVSHCGIKTVELSSQHIESICAASDGKVLKDVLEQFNEILFQIWSDSGLLEVEPKQRVRTAMARTLGRQRHLSADTLDFVRQHVVAHCTRMLDWHAVPSRSQFAYYLRSFAKQDRSILKELASGAFIDGMAAAAAEGQDVATDVLLDLSQLSSRVASRAARCCVLESTPEMLCVASSSTTAIKGILAVTAADKSAWQALLWSLDGWLSTSASALKSDSSTAEDAVRTVQLTAACMEALQHKSKHHQAGKAADGMLNAAAAAADLAVNIVNVSKDPKVVASALAALSNTQPTEACLKRLCSSPILAPAIQRMRPGSDACDANTVLNSTLKMGAMHDSQVLQFLIQGDVLKACMGFVSAILDQWANDVQDGLQGAALTQGSDLSTSPDAAEDAAQQVGQVSVGPTLPGQGNQAAVNESSLDCTVPVAFVEQAAAMHTAARLCMAMTQAATASSPRLVDPILFLGKYRLWTLNELREDALAFMAARNMDSRLKKTLEATTLILSSTSTHLDSLPQPVLTDQIADATSSLVERIQAGTTSTVCQFQGVFKQWRGDSTQKGEIQQAGSLNGSESRLRRTDSNAGMTERSTQETAPVQSTLFKMFQSTSRNVQIQAGKARETLASTIKKG